MTELEALQNLINSIKLDGINIHEKYLEDKRKKTKVYFVTINGTTISPVLSYENMNHFMLGFLKATTL